MIRPLILATMLIGGLAPGGAHAETELVLVLDNSASMVVGSQMTEPSGTVRELAPADPDRLAVLGTLLLQQIRDPDDVVHILNFDPSPPYFRSLPTRPKDIRGLRFDAPTLFRGVLQEARRLLEQSTAERRLLIFLTDGLPSDEDFSPEEAVALLGLDQETISFDVLILGLASDPDLVETQDAYLRPLAGRGGRFERVSEPVELITKFTQAYAEQLGSKPESGTLKPGGSHTVEVGKYVSEVILMTAGIDRAGPYGATLSENGRDVPLPPDGQGDNGCTSEFARDPRNPRLCRPPFHHYRVWKAPDNPKKTSRWTLQIDGRAKTDVAYGFILRYDLLAEIVEIPARVHVGQSFELTARISFEGRAFDEEEFFGRDGFEAVAILEGREVPLARQPDSTFTATVTPSALGAASVRVEFRNRWMRLPASADLLVEGYLPLSLSLEPSPVDFGHWRGAAGRIEECRTVRVSGQNAHRVPLDVAIDSLPEGLVLTLDGAEAIAGDVAQLPVGAGGLELCIASLRCCRDLSGGDIAMRVRGRDPHYHAGAVLLPVLVEVEATGFLRCWMRVLIGVLAVFLLLLILYGFIHPSDFESDQRIRFSSSEAKLKRASAMVLRELPGGRRGFYRNATVGFGAGGSPLGPRRKAWLRLQAAGGGETTVVGEASIETKDRRSRKWVPLSQEPGLATLRRRVDYRVGDLYFRIE